MDLKNNCLEVYNTVDRTSSSVAGIVSQISKGNTRVLSDLVNAVPPREHAELALILAYAVVTLYGVNLRCAGTDEKRHPLNRERDRLYTYFSKLRQAAGEYQGNRKLKLDNQSAQRIVKQRLDV